MADQAFGAATFGGDAPDGETPNLELVVPVQLRAYLIATGIVASNEDPPSLARASVWLQPRDGAPLPRRDEAAGDWLEEQTVTVKRKLVNGPPGLEAWMEDAFIDITIRSVNEAAGELLHRAIRGLIHPIGETPAGKRNWMMNDLHVLYSAMFRNEQPLPTVDEGRTYDSVATYRFTCARSDLV